MSSPTFYKALNENPVVELTIAYDTVLTSKILTLDDGSFVTLFVNLSEGAYKSTCVAKIDSEGNLLWIQEVPSPYNVQLYGDIVIDSNNAIVGIFNYLSGSTTGKTMVYIFDSATGASTSVSTQRLGDVRGVPKLAMTPNGIVVSAFAYMFGGSSVRLCRWHLDANYSISSSSSECWYNYLAGPDDDLSSTISPTIRSKYTSKSVIVTHRPSDSITGVNIINPNYLTGSILGGWNKKITFVLEGTSAIVPALDSIKILEDGSIIYIGIVSVAGQSLECVTKFDSSGIFHTAWIVRSIVTSDGGANTISLWDVTVDSTGCVWLVGGTASYRYIVFVKLSSDLSSVVMAKIIVPGTTATDYEYGSTGLLGGCTATNQDGLVFFISTLPYNIGAGVVTSDGKILSDCNPFEDLALTLTTVGSDTYFESRDLDIEDSNTPRTS